MSDESMVERLAAKWVMWEKRPHVSEEDEVRFMLNAIADELLHEWHGYGRPDEWLRTQASTGDDDET